MCGRTFSPRYSPTPKEEMEATHEEATAHAPTPASGTHAMLHSPAGTHRQAEAAPSQFKWSPPSWRQRRMRRMATPYSAAAAVLSAWKTSGWTPTRSTSGRLTKTI
jgi:hypothetical protein